MRYIILDSKNGIFVGTVSEYALFSFSTNVGTYKAYSFESKEKAEDYINTNFHEEDLKRLTIKEVKTKLKYVTCHELIKQGFDTGYMLDFMPMPSEEIH